MSYNIYLKDPATGETAEIQVFGMLCFWVVNRAEKWYN